MGSFIFGGPPRFAHQRRALASVIRTRGRTGLLLDPGLGKTAVVLDYLGLLTLKNMEQETRVLVVCPLAAVDTWVGQARAFLTPQIGFWAEALGGTVLERAEALSSRGGNAYLRKLHPARRRERLLPARGASTRAIHFQKSFAWAARSARGVDLSSPLLGPEQLGTTTPRLVITVVNLDTLAQREEVGSANMSDVLVDAIKRYAPHVLVVDECHPEGTLIATPSGQVPINQLRLGDEVLGFDGDQVVVTHVQRTFTRQTKEPIWRLGDTEATPHHPVWTFNRGYVPIQEIRDGDTILRLLPRDLQASTGDQSILFEIVQATVAVRRAPGVEDSTGRGHALEGGQLGAGRALVGAGQPIPRSGSEAARGGSESSGRVRGDDSRGVEGAFTVEVADSASYSSGMADGGGGDYGLASAVLWIPELLPLGYSERVDESGSRSGWAESPTLGSAGSRQAEGCLSSEDWLECGPSDEQPSTGRAGVGSEFYPVYNIETGTHNYFAAGVLVSNSHKIKSPTGNASRLLARISKSIPRRLLLTGTVMPHGPLDVWAQWRTLDPYAFHVIRKTGAKKPMSFGEFKARYAVMGGFMGKVVKGYDHLDEMQDIMALNSIVIRKADALDLPSTTEVIIPVELNEAEQRAYSEMKNDLAVQLAHGQLADAGSRLTQMLRLRQITAGHLPDDDGRIHVIGHSKVNTIRSLVHDVLVGEKRLVVFAYFKEEIKQLAAVLAEKGTEIQVITGDTHTDARIAMRKRFGSDDPARLVMIAQITTMSLAVNELITASYAIFASLSQRRDELVQAQDRLDRIGQTRPVTYYFCNAPGTVDDVILNTHKSRGDLEAALLKHIQDNN